MDGLQAGPYGGGGDHFQKNPKVNLSQPPCCAGVSLSKVYIRLSINSSQFRAWSAGNMWWMNFGTADCTKNPLQIRCGCYKQFQWLTRSPSLHQKSGVF